VIHHVLVSIGTAQAARRGDSRVAGGLRGVEERVSEEPSIALRVAEEVHVGT
jgi:hypothetical protein